MVEYPRGVGGFALTHHTIPVMAAAPTTPPATIPPMRTLSSVSFSSGDGAFSLVGGGEDVGKDGGVLDGDDAGSDTVGERVGSDTVGDVDGGALDGERVGVDRVGERVGVDRVGDVDGDVVGASVHE